jgi:hypothetical protein
MKDTRFEILTAVMLKSQVFCDVTPCRWVVLDVSKDRSALIFRVKQSNKWNEVWKVMVLAILA